MHTRVRKSEEALPFLCSGPKRGHNFYLATFEQWRCSWLYLLTCKESKRAIEGGRTTPFLASLSNRMATMPKKLLRPSFMCKMHWILWCDSMATWRYDYRRTSLTHISINVIKAKVKRAVLIPYQCLQLSSARAHFRQESMPYLVKHGPPRSANMSCAATPLQLCLLSLLAIPSSHKACLVLHHANNMC